MIKKHLLRTTAITMVFATVLMTTGCGSKQISDNNTTVQQTTETVKVVSNVDVKTEAEKQPEQPEEAKEEQPAENAEAGNTEAEVSAEEVNEAQNTVSEEVQEEQAEPEATPAEQPAEATDTGAVDTTPVEQPAAPADTTPAPVEQPAAPADTTPAPEPTPEPVVTPQEPAKPSVTEEQQLVATGKWTKMYDDSKADDGSIYTYYEYTCPITGYSIEADFKDGTFCRELVNSAEECRAVYNAHGITDTVVSFDRLMKLSNS